MVNTLDWLAFFALPRPRRFKGAMQTIHAFGIFPGLAGKPRLDDLYL